jgi:Heterokaryon incompatibility protein (HET)
LLGKDPQVTTTLQILAANSTGIQITSLSQSIQDAIEITRKPPIRYLWVDVICIAQDSISDKIAEMDGMGNIYKNATLTLAAMNSNSANAGFIKPKA